MKILNAFQTKAVDAATIKNLGIKSIDLMEKAALQCFQWIEKQEALEMENRIHIFCGLGNNGGDGLALARLLSLEFYNVYVYTVHFTDKMSDDFITNYNKAEEYLIHPSSIHSEDDFPKINTNDVIIDAIFGSGLNRSPQGFTKKLIQYINHQDALRISIDIPSGLFIDKPILDKDAIIKSDITLSFQLPKLSFLLSDSAEYVKRFELLDIELDEKEIQSHETSYYYTTDSDFRQFHRKRTKFSHKGTFGHALIMGGSYGKMGSVVLASKAALKVGSGLVTSYIPKCGYQILQTSIPEVMVEVDAENELQFFNFKTKADVIGLGIGMGTDEKTILGFGEFLKVNHLPLVLDADGLNILALDTNLYKYLKEDTVLTPHPKELERLVGSWKDDFEKIDKIRDFTIKYPVVMVVKGAHTMVVKNGNFYFNSTGNAALATAGSGDVLTGLITGFLAQKYTALEAAIMGVYLHGMTADVYTIINPQETFTASDIIHFLSGAFHAILNPYKENEDEFDEDVNFGETDFNDDNDF